MDNYGDSLIVHFDESNQISESRLMVRYKIHLSFKLSSSQGLYSMCGHLGFWHSNQKLLGTSLTP